MDWIIFLIYRLLLLPTLVLLARLLLILKIENKFFQSLKFRIENKFHYRPTFDKNKKSIGIHAASGEIEYAFPLIRKIKECHPEYNIVVTLSSKSVLNSVLNQSTVDAVGPAPLDLFWTVDYFLKMFNFKLFLFARTDVWPEFSWQLKKSKIPSVLFSATISTASAKRSYLTNSLTRRSLSRLDQICTVSHQDRNNLEAMAVDTQIRNLGDTRYDQVLFKKTTAHKNLPKLVSERKIFVAGSTWPEDDEVLLPAMVKAVADWRFVIAPHEIHETSLQKLESYFLLKQLKTQRFSKIENDLQTGMNWDVLLVDHYGYLFNLYGWAQLAFVGGSFRAKVHSVMEPLSYCKPVCVGPFHKNNREAIEFSQITSKQVALNWVSVIKTTDDLSSLLKQLAQVTEIEKNEMEKELSSLVSSLQGATSRIYEQIKTYF